MRLKTLSLTILLLLVGLGMLLVLPATNAQDGDSPPAVTPTSAPPVTPDNNKLVISLPVGDTFDSAQGWLPRGAWVFDDEAGYDGAGWYLDGTQRDKVSTLEYTPLIDLSGALSAQLLYRHKGNLPDTDLIAVDLSLNDGLSWFVLDQQVGIDIDWDLHVVDLTSFRGLVIRLRFRVNTGTQINEDEPVNGGYWVDNLSIQHVMSEPAMVFMPIDEGPKTLLGLHLIIGARHEPVVALAERLNAIGWPLGTLKGTSGTEGILTAVKKVSPETVIVYRSLDTPWGMIDCPNTYNDPVAEARAWMDGIEPYWGGVQADYYELTNECHPPAEWLVPFTIETMRIANEKGKCLLVFSFAGGNPEPEEYAQLLPVYEYALQNPCSTGRYHGVALHAYGARENQLVSESGIWLGFRHRQYYNYILSELPEAIRIPVYLTEVSPSDGRQRFSCEDITRDMMSYIQQLELDPYIRGLHLWNFGIPGIEWVDYTDCLPMIGDALVNYYAGKEFPGD